MKALAADMLSAINLLEKVEHDSVISANVAKLFEFVGFSRKSFKKFQYAGILAKCITVSNTMTYCPHIP